MKETILQIAGAVLIVLVVGFPLILSIIGDFECTKRTESGSCAQISRKP